MYQNSLYLKLSEDDFQSLLSADATVIFVDLATPQMVSCYQYMNSFMNYSEVLKGHVLFGFVCPYFEGGQLSGSLAGPLLIDFRYILLAVEMNLWCAQSIYECIFKLSNICCSHMQTWLPDLSQS